MKQLSNLLKVLISIGFIISIVNLLTYFAPTTTFNFFHSFKSLDLFNKIAGFISGLVFIIILIRTWKNKVIKTAQKLLVN